MVAWETSARADADLVLTTLEYALASREVEPGKLIHHADHGCQYTSIKLTTRLMRAGVEASMGSVGDSYDNALAENLWMLIKTEGLRGRTFTTRARGGFKVLNLMNLCRSRPCGGVSVDRHVRNEAPVEGVTLPSRPVQPELRCAVSLPSA
ncbi:hypothetical protein [Streptomyces scabiei]|uniref:hypothetical protein n=1 Tax=Streptomyces scabiei TaxID=1930 RepID=UPI001FF14591|nr:hypothetical protein [Streptomyces sp. LBUM 1481]